MDVGRNIPGPLAAVAAILLLVAATAPTLGWLDFASGSENLNVSTALEIRRTGQWLVPTLGGEPRVRKPPLTAWITAGLVPDSTLEAIRATLPLSEEAYRRLGWQVRIAPLLAASLTLLAVAGIGRMLEGWRLAFLAVLVCSSSYAFLRFTRAATTDVHLMLWVAMANLGIAAALFRQYRWLGCLGAGAAIGLGFMSKGPVVVVQTLIPALVFGLWRRQRNRRDGRPRPPLARWIAPVAGGAALAAAIAVPWFVLVALRYDVWSIWFAEVTRHGARDLEPSNWYNYISLLPMMLPWLIFFIGGLLMLRMPITAGQRRGLVFAICFTLVPLLVMSLFRDRNERYVLPMIAPASLVAAYALSEHLRQWRQLDRLGQWADAGHWAILAGAGILLPIVGATGLVEGLRTQEGQPWYSPAVAAGAALAAAAILAASLAAYRQWPMALPVGSFVLMLLVQAVFVQGYRRAGGASEMRPLAAAIRVRAPDAAVYGMGRGRHVPQDLAVYLNRTVWPVEDSAEVPGPAPGRVLVVRQRKSEPAPALPPGWTMLETIQQKNNLWHAYVCDPAR